MRNWFITAINAVQVHQERPAENPAEREPRDREPREPKEWTAEEVGFFEPDRADTNGMSTSGKHTFYKDVYVYIDRLRDLEKVQGEEKLRINGITSNSSKDLRYARHRRCNYLPLSVIPWKTHDWVGPQGPTFKTFSAMLEQQSLTQLTIS
ncbi:hypothetical protein MMC12_001596 [Toensbergia leucococca]|nr:hypothetical protein [Toensbergia leucococca]